MTQDKFRSNLSFAMDSLVGLTESFCSNSLVLKYRFIVRPNSETADSHLDQEEIAFHNKIMTYRDKHISNNDVIDLLWINNKVPLWINTSVIESSDTWTTIELVTSRRLRTADELNQITNQFPPFHLQVPLPPDRVDGVKFDINWRNKKARRKGILGMIKGMLVK